MNTTLASFLLSTFSWWFWMFCLLLLRQVSILISCILLLTSVQNAHLSQFVVLQHVYVWIHETSILVDSVLIFHRIISIILSRFILDLRHSSDEGSTHETAQPTLEFAQRVEDGLGGSLNSIWGSGSNEDSDENEDPQPFENFQFSPAELPDQENVCNGRWESAYFYARITDFLSPSSNTYSLPTEKRGYCTEWLIEISMRSRIALKL